MKKTLTVNIAGTAFSIDEESYGMLEGYLSDIERRLIANNNDNESIVDIEIRVMEIIQEKQNGYQAVIDIKLVKYVISVIGSPSIFGDTPNKSNQSNHNKQNTYNHSGLFDKKLYRNPFNAVLAGVCSGLSAYFNIDVVIIRIIMLIFMLSGFGIACYVICWVIIPEAQTMEDLYPTPKNNNN